MVNEVIELSVEHILLFLVAAFLLYYLMGNCDCRNGFTVGGNQKCEDYPYGACFGVCDWVDREPPLKGFCKEKNYYCKPRPRWQATNEGQQCYNIPKSECISNKYCEVGKE